jgi:prevent-host-death family protein
VKKATLTETKNNLSAIIDRVRHGETVLILDRGIPVARIESVAHETPTSEGRLARLERLGLVVRAAGTVPRQMLEQDPPRPRRGASALAALIAERESGR